MKKLKIIFSIPVHEKPEVIIDQIVNIKYFNRECGIVLHFSESYCSKSNIIQDKDFWAIIGRIKNVFVNPQRLRTGWGDIIQCHISNFEFVYKTVEFEYFAMLSSNELFIRKGMYEKIFGYDYGIAANAASYSQDWFGRKVFRDSNLKKMLKNINKNQIFKAQIEGSFYKKELMNEICQIINIYYDYKKDYRLFYPREEVYFATLAMNMYRKKNNYKLPNTYMNHKKRLKISLIELIYIMLFKKTFFSIKRIDRNMYYSLRAFIRQTKGYFEFEKKIITGLRKERFIVIKNIQEEIRWKYEQILGEKT